MALDRVRPAALASRQRTALARYLAEDVYPYSQRYRRALDRVGIGHSRPGLFGRAPRLRGRRGKRPPLGKLAPVELAELGAGEEVVLAPTAEEIARFGTLGLRWRWWLAGITGRRGLLATRLIDPDYKPLVWYRDGRALQVALTATDLDQLGDIGRRMLEQVGVRTDDVLLDLCPLDSGAAHWQLVLGCRDAGVAAAHVGPSADPASARAFEPTVVAGRPGDLVRVLGAPSPASAFDLRVVLAVGEPLDPEARERLTRLAPGATVVNAWAPAGVRALWCDCPGGLLHTWPDAELLEVVDPVSDEPAAVGADGEVLWTGIGWHGTVLLRLRTGVFGRVHRDPCPLCGRTSPRLEIVPLDPPFATVLDTHPGVAAWQAELRAATPPEPGDPPSEGDGVDAGEVVIYLTPVERDDVESIVEALDADLRPQIGVAQFVVLTRAALDARLDREGGRRVVDLR